MSGGSNSEKILVILRWRLVKCGKPYDVCNFVRCFLGLFCMASASYSGDEEWDGSLAGGDINCTVLLEGGYLIY